MKTTAIHGKLSDMLRFIEQSKHIHPDNKDFLIKSVSSQPEPVEFHCSETNEASRELGAKLRIEALQYNLGVDWLTLHFPTREN